MCQQLLVNSTKKIFKHKNKVTMALFVKGLKNPFAIPKSSDQCSLPEQSASSYNDPWKSRVHAQMMAARFDC